MTLKEEIFEQPASLQRLLDRQASHIDDIASQIKTCAIRSIFLAARGTSDHAGLYAKYLWGMHNQLPVALAAPSMFSIYHKPPALQDSLVVAISQSGASPDIVSVVKEGKRQGALTLAITNEAGSPLAMTSDMVIDVCAGPEFAVAATKTYTAELMAIVMLSQALAGEDMPILEQIPAWVQNVLRLDPTIQRIAERYRYMHQCVVIGRGYNYATAYEWALKLKELTYSVAAPYSSADFLHGPIAMVGQGFPVLAVAPGGKVFPDLLTLMERLKLEYQVELLVVSDQDMALELADSALKLPEGVPEWLSPIVSIVPAQLFSYYLTRAKGFDTEAPRTLKKVTKTT
ncbi:MAG: SIS domain-containing protein [Anaerolineae bacterium]|nr:SIS domain-containing protein [Anaerolineae bacterium]